MKKAGVFFAILMLSGCLFGGSTQSRFYQLQVFDGDVKPVSSRRLNIGVEEAYVPKFLDKPQMVTQKVDTFELNVSEFERWAEPLSSSFSRVLADDISLYLPKSVVKYKTLSSEEFEYALTVEINNWNAILGQKLEMDVWWTVYKNGDVIVRNRSKLSSELGNSYEDLADKQSKLINDLALQISQRFAKM